MTEPTDLPPLPEPFDLPTAKDVFDFVGGNCNSVEFEHEIPPDAFQPDRYSANDTYCMSAHDIASAVSFMDLFTADQMSAYAREAVKAERERCAAICMAKAKDFIGRGVDEWWEAHAHGSEECAAAIRGEEV